MKTKDVNPLDLEQITGVKRFNIPVTWYTNQTNDPYDKA